jgi:uncharacterized BrkB/YihY/UPF0761 family membrane protein
MNVFGNVAQGPARAIVADIVPEDKQQAGNAMVSGVMGLAAVTANIVGAQFFQTAEPYRYLFSKIIMCIFPILTTLQVIGVGFLLLSTIPTLIAGREKPGFDYSAGEKKMNILHV